MAPRRGGRPSRRNEILAAAVDLLARNGTRGTTLESIAQQIGVTRPAITHHFGSKEELLSEVVAVTDVMDIPSVSSAEARRGIERLASLRSWAKALVANPDLATVSRLGTVLTIEAYDPDSPAREAFISRHRLYREGVTAILRRGQRDGSIRKDVDARHVAAEITAFMLGASVQWFLDPRHVDIVRIYDSYFDRLIGDLAVGR